MTDAGTKVTRTSRAIWLGFSALMFGCAVYIGRELSLEPAAYVALIGLSGLYGALRPSRPRPSQKWAKIDKTIVRQERLASPQSGALSEATEDAPEGALSTARAQGGALSETD